MVINPFLVLPQLWITKYNNKYCVQTGVHSVTISELLSNGYVMAGIVLISAIAQGSFSQSSTHILNVEGIRLKTALQVIVCQTLVNI